MALTDVISQLGTTIINLVSNTVQGIADYINNNSGDISDTGGGTTGTPGTITIPDPLTVNQLNTSMIKGSNNTGEDSPNLLIDAPRFWIVDMSKIMQLDEAALMFMHNGNMCGLVASDHSAASEDEANITVLHLVAQNSRYNSADSGLYVNDSAVITNATLPNTEFSMLNTTDKTIIGAINELKERLDNQGA